MSDVQQLRLQSKLELIEKARIVLRGEKKASGYLEALYLALEAKDQFAYATDVLLKKMEQDRDNGKEISLKENQKLARYIYKDHSLPSSFKFDRALDELTGHDPLAITKNCETLGLAGAIYKRKWQYDHQFKNLVLSRHFYKLGYNSWKEYNDKYNGQEAYKKQCDNGYTAINYAFINELMATDKLEEHGAVTGVSNSIAIRFKEAEEARKYILTQLITDITKPDLTLKVPEDKWIIATIAEAWFGLCEYDHALVFINRFVQLTEADPWEVRTFSQQLFSIAWLQLFIPKFMAGHQSASLPGLAELEAIAKKIEQNKIFNCLQTLALSTDDTGGNTVPEIKKEGRWGLALSGGGFRASLFHIGVLASMAEHNELKNLEVISCVSGGSIIGAYYYLKLKALLEAKKDAEITQADYIQLVKEIEDDFLNGVQKNLRMRIFSNLYCNFKMLFNKNYSRTHRLGELYEMHLYKNLWKKDERYKNQLQHNNGNIYMNDLLIKPADNPNSFSLALDNWKRKNKVPQLILNATSVNTGHNWQFTATWMGEPPGNIQADIDVKPRLRRMYYPEAPEEYRNFRLGYAVGASSCVPVMFHPMPMKGLYEDVDLQLVDGGLHDNQGIAALIEQECKNMIISDASGQMPTSNVSTHNEAAIFYRADTILQERLRELQFMDIKARNHTTQLSILVTVHLKNGLQQYPVKWTSCDDPTREILYSNVPDTNTDLTEYGILRHVQSSLSEIRTDLDSFHDAESYALMYSGYKQMNHEFSKNAPGNGQYMQGHWNFLDMKSRLTENSRSREIEPLLAAGKKLAFKVMDVSKPVKVISFSLGALLVAWLLYRVYQFFFVEEGTFNSTVFAIDIKAGALVILVAAFITGLFSKFLSNLVNIKSFLRKKLVFIAVILIGCLVSNFYLVFLNRLYNNAGKIKQKSQKVRKPEKAWHASQA